MHALRIATLPVATHLVQGSCFSLFKLFVWVNFTQHPWLNIKHTHTCIHKDMWRHTCTHFRTWLYGSLLLWAWHNNTQVLTHTITQFLVASFSIEAAEMVRGNIQNSQISRLTCQKQYPIQLSCKCVFLCVFKSTFCMFYWWMWIHRKSKDGTAGVC